MRIGLSALSFSYQCGLIGAGTPRAVVTPMHVEGLLALASRAGLDAVAFPFTLLPDLSDERLGRLHTRLTTYGLTPVLDAGPVDVAILTAQIPAAAALGSKVLRVLVSDVLEGARFTLAGGWEAQLSEVITRLRRLRPLAERHGICLAVENHQDATADDLVRICEEVGGDAIGVTFDPVNAIIVGEAPLAALEQLKPYIRNIHLADYVVYPSDEGYRLVRCALGEGATNFRELFDALGKAVPEATCQIELIGHNARHIRLLSDEWWQGYGPQDVRMVLPVLRLLAQNLRTFDEDWRTPWERGADEETLKLYEDQQFASSVHYLRTIGALAAR